jgi:hypothetical protein
MKLIPWPNLRAWLSLDYWAYRRLRRSARKAGKSYAVTGLTQDDAAKLSSAVSDIAPVDEDKILDSVTPVIFQRPSFPPGAIEAARKVVVTHFEGLEKDLQARVQARIDARPEPVEESAKRIIERARAMRPTK